jgi:rSAM/selenodomain-associated transferase 2
MGLSAGDGIKLSIIIPILNEAHQIGPCLERLKGSGAEIIIADGGSQDTSLAGIPEHVSRVVHCARGRARQMNAGARVARGRILVFLHADTQIGQEAWQRLYVIANNRDPLWGRFNVRLSDTQWPYRLIATCMNLRSRLTGICTGDQVLFISADLFGSCGGFPEIALMEDIAISSRLRKYQPPLCCTEQVTTSSRRWRQKGVLKTILLMWRLRLAYFFGADPDYLASLYYRKPST